MQTRGTTRILPIDWDWRILLSNRGEGLKGIRPGLFTFLSHNIRLCAQRPRMISLKRHMKCPSIC